MTDLELFFETSGQVPRLTHWLVEARLAPKVKQNVERLCRAEDVQHVALMPDLHLGRLINNGMVIATTDLIYPQAVGSDIGCGFSAIAFQGTIEPLREPALARELFAAFYEKVPAFKQRRAEPLPDSLASLPLSEGSLVRGSERDGARQLGTLGCGNHFLEMQRDDAGQPWLMIHSGSRAMGQWITEFHLRKAATSATGLRFLDLRKPEGRTYFQDMEWAIQYARSNRLSMMAHVSELLEANLGWRVDQSTYIDSPHNYARREEHFGATWIVHRKSAASAQDGELGLVAGSMGSPSFIVRGRGNPDALHSCAHGAGRLMGRKQAHQQIRARDLQRQLGQVHCDPRNFDALRDEAPAAYRDIREVMRAQKDLTKQVTCLTPLLNFKYPDPRD